ncbi:DNA polymerase [Streptomyces sp. NBC_00470]|uniref:DNA polymerase n=1 Tax=Streptomyces sp. NBC_00470 TaxID=2975753 RepID=UPI0030E576D3
MRDTVTTTEQLDETVRYFLAQDEFAIDLETMGEHRGEPNFNEVRWVGIATKGRTAIIPCGHPNGDELLRGAQPRKGIEAVWSDPPPQLRPSQVMRGLEPLLFSTTIRKIAHHLPFDIGSLAKYFGGVFPPPPYADSMIGLWLLNENRPKGLKPNITRLYGHDYDQENVGKCIEKHGFSTVHDYLFYDVTWTYILWQRIKKALPQEDLDHVAALEWADLEPVLEMHREGVTMDVDQLRVVEKEFSAKLAELEADVYHRAGRVFNINSAQQKQDLLFLPKKMGGQGLKATKLTPAGRTRRREGKPHSVRDYSTDAKVLGKFSGENKVCGLLKEHSMYSTLLTTFIHPYLGTDEKPGVIRGDKIYPRFNPAGTDTGRFSGSGPNFQNLPARTPQGRRIRGCVVAPDGHILIVSDYSQLEPRVTAHFLGRGAWYEGFHNGIDSHTATAATVFGVDPDHVTPDLRNKAKTLSLAILFGTQEKSVAEQLGISEREAAEILKAHQRTMPEVYQYKELLLEHMRRMRVPTVKTLMGRKRRIVELRSQNKYERLKAERQAFNSKIQGSEGDLVKYALVRLHKANQQRGKFLKLHITVHDEIVISAPKDRVEEGVSILQDAMCGAGIARWLSVPLLSSVHTVDTWAEAK